MGRGREPIPGRDRRLVVCERGAWRTEIRAAVAAQMEQLAGYSAFFDLANRPVLELAEALAERARCRQRSSWARAAVKGSTLRPSWHADIGGRSASRTGPYLSAAPPAITAPTDLGPHSRNPQQPPGLRPAGRDDSGPP